MHTAKLCHAACVLSKTHLATQSWVTKHIVSSSLSDVSSAFLAQDTKAALELLANSYKAEEIGEHCYHLYEQFRPTIASGQAGWGQKGQLDLMHIRQLAEQH